MLNNRKYGVFYYLLIHTQHISDFVNNDVNNLNKVFYKFIFVSKVNLFFNKWIIKLYSNYFSHISTALIIVVSFLKFK